MKIKVVSPSRLHLGFYTIVSKKLAYGSIGIAVNIPNTIIIFERSNKLRIRNNTNININKEIQFVLSKLALKHINISINIEKVITRHVGLGSTTQLMLSLAYGINKLLHLGHSIRELAYMLRRGWVSGIGIAAFEKGGFIMDNGRHIVNGKIKPIECIDDIPRVMFRRGIPGSWTFIIATPLGIKGLDEREERKYLEIPTPMYEIEKSLHEVVLTEMLPAITTYDIRKFGCAMTKVQMLTGKYFSKFQGGIFCCEETELIINKFLEYGAYGAGQSSWGPTAYALVDNVRHAKKIINKLLKDLYHNDIVADIYISKVCNSGAKLYVL